jgi:sugar phosphate isomerase/epimerase
MGLTMQQKLATRLNSFRLHQGQKLSVEQALRDIAKVEGISAVELNFPQHFSDGNVDVLKQAQSCGLAITALNLRYDGPDFIHGAFTHPNKDNRDKAISISIHAAEVAAANNIDHVILWMGPDGYDYPFQADYRQLWDFEIEGFRRVASVAPDVRVSVEYKPSDPRRFSLVRNMGEALTAVSDVGLPNFGVTLDYCHLLMAGENPAFAAALALKQGKLFGVHLNDGYGPADDGMMVGTVSLWQTLELLWELRKADFKGTIYFDTFPDRMDPAVECAANVAMIRKLQFALEKMPLAELKKAQSAQNAVLATRLFHDLLL